MVFLGCGRTGGLRAVYGHVITKFSRMGRFTYPWCSAGALCAPELRYKRLVYKPPDLLARICKVNLSNAKKFGLICFPRICFRGQIYCDLKCDRRCFLFFGCTYIRLATRCIPCFTLKKLSLSLKSLMNVSSS